MDAANSTVVMLLLSMISTELKFIVDRMIGAPGHRKDMIDGINACDNRYLMVKMCTIVTTEADDKE